MKRLISLLAVGGLCLVGESVTRPWTCLNLDADFYQNSYPDSMMNAKDIDTYVSWLCDGGKLTHLFVNPQGMNAGYPSRVLEPFWAPKPWCADKPTSDMVRRSKELFDKGVDLYGTFLASARKRGVEGWLSMRMNDVHGAWDVNDPGVSAYWREHPELWREPNTKRNDCFARAFDFAHPVVRLRAIAIAAEMLERWDVAGIEADWTRFPAHLTPGKAKALSGHLTEVMRAIREKANAAAKRRGHPVRVAAAVLSTPEAAENAGMDAVTWAKEGLIDVLMVANFFFCTDFDTPYREWCGKIHAVNPKVRIIPRLDSYLCRLPQTGIVKGEEMEVAHYRGLLDNLMAEGCRDFGFFNFFEAKSPRGKLVLSDGITPENVLSQTRKYAVTFRDWTADGTSQCAQFPIAGGVTKEVRVKVGTVGDVAQVFVDVGLNEVKGKGLVVELNGKKPIGEAKEPAASWCHTTKVPQGLRFAFDRSAVKPGTNIVKLVTPSGVKALGLDLVIEPASPK